MALIHFAFGGLFREGKAEDQLSAFIKYILAPKMLKASICPEFMPIIGTPGGKTAVPSSARDMGDGSVGFTEWIDSPPVSLLPNDVWMVSFVDLPIKKLKHWSPSGHYGRLGIAFSNEFRARMGIRHVTYYQYPNLARDPMVIALNQAQACGDKKYRDKLMTDVVQYRKPAVLWKEFNTLFTPLRLTKIVDGVEIESLTYSRYEIGYNFREEQEARLVKGEEDRLVQFSENDVLMVIVPDENAKQKLEDFFKRDWSRNPKIQIFPQ